MNNDYWNPRTDDRKEEKPPYSKVFILFSKGHEIRETEIREAFQDFGQIEDIYVPKDRASGETRGIAYVKFTKTSSAAAAIAAMHLKRIGSNPKPVKVLLATNKNDKNDDTSEKCSRLFIKIGRQATEAQIEEHFSQFGELLSVHILKDRHTQESKGLAYVNFSTFLDAAKAFEECDESYKAVFAAPKTELKRGRDNNDSFYDYSSNNSTRVDPYTNNKFNSFPALKTAPQNKTVYVTCSPGLAQRHIERLFKILPGMQQCQYTDTCNGYCKAQITYDNESSANLAVERLDNYEFPSGEIVTVKPDNPLSNVADSLSSIVNSFKHAVDSGKPELLQLADAIAQASTLLKAATTGKTELTGHDLGFCSVSLPPMQSMAPPNSRTAKRCFVVFKPGPPPISVLRDTFCRFGDLIEFNIINNKTFGFASYASETSAQRAIDTLHGATLYGVSLKVMEADERPNKVENFDLSDVEMVHDTEKKRMKY